MKFLRTFIVFSLLGMALPVSAAAGALDISARGVAAGSVPQGAARVEMLKVSLKASCDADVQIDALHMHHEGLGAASDIERVYVSDGRRRISRTSSFSGNDRIATIRTPGLIIKRCSEQTISVLADFSPSTAAGSEHRIVLESIADISSDARNVTLSNTDTPAIARSVPAAQGIITVEYLPLHGTIRYGANRKISRLRLEADGKSDHFIHAITLTNDGSARNGDLRNLWIEISGKRASGNIRQLNGDAVTFTFDPPVLLERNATRIIQVHADVRAGKRRTIQLTLEEPSDLDASIQKQRGVQFQ